MPGLGEEDRRAWRDVVVYPNTTIDLYPDQILIWRINPDGALRTADDPCPSCRAAGRRTRLAQYANREVKNSSGPRKSNSRRTSRPGSRRGARAGALSGREAAVGWFADRVRANLGDEAG
jgi:choline monooxygenase